MFKVLQIMVLLVGLSLVALSWSQSSSTFSVALLEFNVIPASNELANPALGQIMAVVLERALVNSKRFVVVERTSIKNVVNELALSEQGFVGSEDVKNFGEFKGVDIVVYGDILIFSDYYDITAKFVEVASSQISQAPSLIVDNVQAFSDVAQRFVDEAKVRFPLQGLVVQLEADGAYVRLGTDNGLTQQDTQGIILRERTIAGSVILSEIGSFTIERIFPELSLISPTMKEGIELQEGDIIRVTPEARAVNSAESEPVTTTQTGSLVITTVPVLTEIFLNGEPKGVTPQTLSDLAAGVYQVELRAENYQTLSEPVEVLANEAKIFDKLLLPNEATLVLEIAEPAFEVFVDGLSLGQQTSLSLTPGKHIVDISSPNTLGSRLELELGPGEQLSQNIVLEKLGILQLNVPPGTEVIAVAQADNKTTSFDLSTEQPAAFQLPAGDYRLLITLPDQTLVSERANLVAGQTMQFDVLASLEPEPPVVATESAEASTAPERQESESKATQASEANPEPTEETDTSESQNAESVKEANKTLALAEGEASLKISTNLPGVRIVFENVKGSKEFFLEDLEQTIALAADIYTYAAIVSGAASIEDVVFLSRGETVELALEFELAGVLVLGGTFNAQGKFDLLLVPSIQTDDKLFRLSLAGPEAWNNGLPLVTRVAKDETYLWLGNYEAFNGMYQASLFNQKGENIRSDFQVLAKQILEPISNVTFDFSNSQTVTLSWTAPEESQDYQVDIYLNNAEVSSLATNQATLNLSRATLKPGSNYNVCISNFNWVLGEIPTAQPNAARACSLLEVPQASTASSSGSSGSGTPPPPPPLRPIPPPPNF